jgi:hypothetical protein
MHLGGAGVIDEGVKKHHGPKFQAVVEHAFVGQQLRDMAVEAAGYAFIDSDQRVVLRREPQDQAPVER